MPPADDDQHQDLEDVLPDVQPGTSRAEIHDMDVQPDVPTLQPRPQQRPKGKSKSRPTTEETSLMDALDAHQATNTRLQGEIQSLLNPAPMSREAQFSSWLGSMAETLHPSLTQRYYMESFQLMMGLQDESRQIFASSQQPPTQTFVPIQPPVTNYVPVPVLDVAPNPYNMDQTMVQNQHDQFQNWQQVRQDTQQQLPPRSQSAATPSWDTSAPASGQVLARPASTPATDGSLNISQLNFSQTSGNYSFTDMIRHHDVNSEAQDLSMPNPELRTPPAPSQTEDTQ